LVTAREAGLRARRAREISSPVSPAPITSTDLSLRSPSISSARSTAADPTETERSLMLVSFRTLFPTAMAFLKAVSSIQPVVPAWDAICISSFIWPRIWSSPMIMDSSPDARRSRWIRDSL